MSTWVYLVAGLNLVMSIAIALLLFFPRRPR